MSSYCDPWLRRNQYFVEKIAYILLELRAQGKKVVCDLIFKEFTFYFDETWYVDTSTVPSKIWLKLVVILHQSHGPLNSCSGKLKTHAKSSKLHTIAVFLRARFNINNLTKFSLLVIYCIDKLLMST